MDLQEFLAILEYQSISFMAILRLQLAFAKSVIKLQVHQMY